VLSLKLLLAILIPLDQIQNPAGLNNSLVSPPWFQAYLLFPATFIKLILAFITLMKKYAVRRVFAFEFGSCNTMLASTKKIEKDVSIPLEKSLYVDQVLQTL
jgi:hypothetical protein